MHMNVDRCTSLNYFRGNSITEGTSRCGNAKTLLDGKADPNITDNNIIRIILQDHMLFATDASTFNSNI